MNEELANPSENPAGPRRRSVANMWRCTAGEKGMVIEQMPTKGLRLPRRRLRAPPDNLPYSRCECGLVAVSHRRDAGRAAASSSLNRWICSLDGDKGS